MARRDRSDSIATGRRCAAYWAQRAPLHGAQPIRSLRECLIAMVVQATDWVDGTAPAWASMTDDERARLTAAAMSLGSAWRARPPLDRLGSAGRSMLTAVPRANLETLAMSDDARRVLALRIADGG